MTEKLPKSIAQSTLKIGDVELVCHVLDNGQRVFECDGIEELLSGAVLGVDETARIARWIKGHDA